MKTLLASLHHAVWNRMGISINGSDFSPAEVRQATKEIEKTVSDRLALLDVLYTVLPYIEDAELDPAYKPGAVAKVTAQARAALAKAEGVFK